MTTQNARYQLAQRDSETLAVSNLKTRELRWAGDTRRLVGKLNNGVAAYEGGYTRRYLERFTNLATAITAFGVSNIEALCATTLTLTADATLPSNVATQVLKGGVFALNGFTLTINGPFKADLSQCFSGSGLVVFGKGSVNDLYPQWWGAKGDDSTDSYAAINAATLAASTLGGGRVRLVAGIYRVSGAMRLRSAMSLVGDPRTYIVPTTNGMTVFDSSGSLTTDFTISQVFISNTLAKTGVTGIDAVQCRHNVLFEKIMFDSIQKGGYFHNLCWQTTVRDCYAYGCGTGFEATNSSHQLIFDRCTAYNSVTTDSGTGDGFYIHGEPADTEPFISKTMLLQCLSQGNAGYGVHLKNTDGTTILGGYVEANTLGDIFGNEVYYLTTDAVWGGGNGGASHIKLRTCQGARLRGVICPGTRTTGTFDIDNTNVYCEGDLQRGTSNNLLSGDYTGLHMQENINGSLRLGGVGHSGYKMYGVVDTIASAARHWHPITNNRNDKNDVAATNIIDCRSQYDVWRKGVRGGEFITFTNPEDGQTIFLILRGASDMGDRPNNINVGGYNINMAGAAADQNTIIALEYDGDYGWIVLADTGWNQYGNRAADAEGLRLRSSSAIPSTTGTYKKGDVVHNNNISSTNGIHGWKCTASGTFSAFSQTCGSVSGSPLLVGLTTTLLHVGDFVSMSAGFAALTIAQVLGFRTNSTAVEAAGVSTNLSAVITGLADTSDFNVGDFVTASAGFPSTVIPYKITAKTASTLTLSTAATSSQTGITVQAVAGVELDTNANATVVSPGITVTTPDPTFERFGRALDKDFSVSYAQTAGTNEVKVENTGTGAADHAKLHAVTTGDGGGNPSMHCEIPGFGSISLGLDNAKANNPGILAYSSLVTAGIIAEFYPAANGGVQWKMRVQDSAGASIAAAADLTLGTDGNYFPVSVGTGTVNGIAIANWQAGARICIEGTGAVTMKHNTAASAGFASMFMKSAGDVVLGENKIIEFRLNAARTLWLEV